MNEDFQFVQPLDLLTKDVPELQKIIRERKENLRDRPMVKDKVPAENDREHDAEPSKDTEKEKQQREKERDRERTEKDKEREKGKDKEKPREDIPNIKQNGDKISVKQEENGIGGGNLHSVVFPCTHVFTAHFVSSGGNVLHR